MLHNIIALIPNWADEDGGPKRGAIFAVETNLKIAFGAACERGFDLRQRRRIGGAPEQEVDALAEHFLPAVPG